MYGICHHDKFWIFSKFLLMMRWKCHDFTKKSTYSHKNNDGPYVVAKNVLDFKTTSRAPWYMWFHEEFEYDLLNILQQNFGEQCFYNILITQEKSAHYIIILLKICGVQWISFLAFLSFFDLSKTKKLLPDKKFYLKKNTCKTTLFCYHTF